MVSGVPPAALEKDATGMISLMGEAFKEVFSDIIKRCGAYYIF